MFGSRFNNNRFGFLYAPNPVSAGTRPVGTLPPQESVTTEPIILTEEDDNDEEPEGLNESIKAYLAKQIAKVGLETASSIETAKREAREEAKAELIKEQKTTDRKVKADRAKADGDKEAELEIARQETADLKAENEQIKATAGKETERSIKSRLAKAAGLPETFNVDRLLGNNETDWTSDAKEMAKSLKVVATNPDLEGGSRPKSTEEQQKLSAQKAARRALSAF